MAGHGAALGGAHAVEFVAGLEGAVEMQMVDHRLRVVRLESRQCGVGFAEDGGLSLRGQVFCGFGRVADHADVEFAHPGALRRARRHVPVVVRLVVHQHRPLARGVGDPAVRMPGQGQPGLELGIGLEGIGTVVEELVFLDAGGDQEVIETAFFERPVHARLDCGQVCAI